MVRNELQGRNLLDVIGNCLEEHVVELAEGDSVVPMSLIEVNAPSNLAVDFGDTFQLEPFKVDLARKVWGAATSTQTYGVLVNSDLEYAFAFNRAFADLNGARDRVTFGDPEEILLAAINGSGQSLLPDVPALAPDDSDDGGDDMVFRYALQGGKTGFRAHLKRDVSFERKSLLPVVRAFYDQKIVDVKTDSGVGRFALVETGYKTRTMDDFTRTYAGAEGFQERVAEELFGNEPVDNTYGILFDPTLRMTFAFNTRFAAYDSSKQDVVYKTCEEALLADTKGRDVSDSSGSRTVPVGRSGSGRGRGGGMVFKYALQGKRD